ncbi:putative guanyl-nucleotide exchange factor [Danaus plexippus plexippus]|uniref:Guanyl-nucleotide exchange factor n=1 Tax=Danaus plexippus plexippus TaxID=278856 RepID=A0A212EUD1_DANPL|nr:putative guanyl-nucleotide exchange factor [Danaus plexippus plexippus]
MATMDLTNEVVRLRAELEKVSTERDMLLCEVSNLRRELELSELKNLQDDRQREPTSCLLSKASTIRWYSMPQCNGIGIKRRANFT